jgi:GH25 family lysozyme M1 (1,4-beta-N-acetylmuramidase)
MATLMRTLSPRAGAAAGTARTSALPRRLTAALTAVAAVGLLGVVGGAGATPARAASAPAVVRTGSVVRFNVGATHSPQVEHSLAGTPAVLPGHAAPRSASAGASPAVTASSVQGIDVSSGQHPNGAAINWSDIASDGYKFAFIKVTEGSYYVNRYYAEDAADADSAGLFVAPYAFAIPNYSGGALQADYALDNVGPEPGGRMLPLILDIEYDPYAGEDGTPANSWCYGLSKAHMVAWISSFITEAKRRTGELPVIYTAASWWNRCTGKSTKFIADPLWIEGYTSSSPATPHDWSDWTYWQYTADATPNGIPLGTNGKIVPTDASWLSSSALELAGPGSQSDPTGGAANLQLNALTSATAVTYGETGLPTGTSIDTSSGLVSGALPGSAATFPVSVTASAAGVPSATQKFSWYVHGPVSFSPLTSQAGSVGSPVRHQVAASDGLSGCTLQYTATGLPPGLTMSDCGMITGWPTAAGSYDVSVSAADSSGAAAQGSVSWQVRRASGRGAVGVLRLIRDGRCLDALSAADIAIENCGAGRSERWTIAADGTLRVSGKCLTAVAPKSKAPAAVDLSTCTGGTGQRWQPGSNAVLTSVSYGRCLADVGVRNGSRASASKCQATSNATGSASTPSTSQQWTVPAGELTSGIVGFCASSLRGKTQPTGSVTLRSCNGKSQQAWTLEPDGAISTGGQCLDLAGGRTAPETDVRLATCSAKTTTQKWQLSGGPIGERLLSPVAGLCLSDPSDRAKAGQLLTIGPCVAGDAGISWRVS